jgi:hypothetical protein
MSFPVKASKNYSIDQKYSSFPWNKTITIEPNEITKVEISKISNFIWIGNNDEGGTTTSVGGGLTITGSSIYDDFEVYEIGSSDLAVRISEFNSSFPGSLFIYFYGVDRASLTLQDVIELLASNGTFISTGLTVSASDPAALFILDPATNSLVIPLSKDFSTLRLAFNQDDFDLGNSFNFKGKIKFPPGKISINNFFIKNEGTNPVDISIVTGI